MNILQSIIVGSMLLSFMFGTVQYMRANKLSDSNDSLKQSLVNKDEEIRAIGVAVNNELKRADNESKNEIIRNDNTLRIGTRRVR